MARFNFLDVTADQTSGDVWFYVSVYIGLSILLVMLGTAKYIYAYTASVRASRLIFNKAVDKILAMSLGWFGTMPVGRIVNRFTADFSILDSRIVDDMCQTTYVLVSSLQLRVLQSVALQTAKPHLAAALTYL